MKKGCFKKEIGVFMILLEKEALNTMIVNTGEKLINISKDKPVILVFLRHFGCQFCREALSNLSEIKPLFDKKGIELVFVHMSEDKIAELYFQKFHFNKPIYISDPQCRYYEAFGLTKGSLNQLFGLQTWVRGFTAQKAYGSEVGKHLGDNFQMPGMFNICEGNVMQRYIHKNVAAKPDYNSFIENCCKISPKTA